MNFLIKDAHTFSSWAEQELVKLFKEAPTFISVADTTLAWAAPIITTIITLENPLAGAIVGSVLTQVVQDLTVVRAVLYDAGPNPTTKSLLAAVQTNLQSILTDSKVSNPVSVALITKVLNSLAALLNSFPETDVAK